MRLQAVLLVATVSSLLGLLSLHGLGVAAAKSAAVDPNCKWGLVPKSTCTQKSTGNCPTDCNVPINSRGSDGVSYSGKTIFGTEVIAAPGKGGLSNGTTDVDCYATATCSQKEMLGTSCDAKQGRCMPSTNSKQWCVQQYVSLGAWTKAPNGEVLACPSDPK